MNLRTVFILFVILQLSLLFVHVSFFWTLGYFMLGFVDGEYLFISSLCSILASLLTSYENDLWLTFTDLILEFVERMERENSNE